MFRPLFVVLVVEFTLISTFVNSHNESGEWSCESSDSGTQLVAGFRPGVITLDGHPDDWKDVNGFDFSLFPALDPHEDDAYKNGKMNVKALHDGKDVFFLLEVDGEYAYSKGNSNKCPSVALMFQIGENATYHNMGGCKESPGSCTNKSCRGYEVDIMHFSIGTAIPGRLYGGNLVDVGTGGDRFGHLVDVYSWNPHCRYLDGHGPSGSNNTAHNDWKGAWWHSSLDVHSGFVDEDSPYASNGKKGTYYFEFSRPLRTMDRFQQDAQFKIGDTSKFSAAFWYPVDGNPWHGSEHYTVSCDWLPLDFISGGSMLTATKATTSSSWDAAVAFSFLLSVVAFCSSVFVGYRVSKRRDVPYTQMGL
ncbi:hypothetical protein BVRB_5g122010 [Beta vulgaris subsp. vulgaris]|uniref:uncharacterized protein LOC104894786 n=1 Tax=Beta vulgaris subsp. vulgaris TaxID=3555 RepID=UPI00053FACDC|nr:uncharacterized protein LOC104894786 [Beta vulgaris subsp. vulgaris]KMT09985.1 hypothetical protein BVRB_5g122010 [Beta vulgaris subsp. vulgaris]